MKPLFILLALLPACAAQVDAGPDLSICYTHEAGEFLSRSMVCEDTTSPACGFTSNNEPVPVSPDYPVEFVCHCIGGTYACFGRQP